VRTSVRLNNDIPIDRLIEVATVAEAVGFDQLWVSNDLFLRSAPVLMGVLAGATRRIQIGIGVLNPYSMHPAEIAMVAATVQEVSDGRFLLGLAQGAEEFLGWAGIDRPSPLARTRAAVHAVRTLLAGGRPADATAAGAGWRPEAYLRTGAAPTPIYLGGMGPRMLELAGEVADGALPLLFPPEHFSVAAAQVAEGAKRAGREMSSIDLAACIWCSIDEDADRGRRALAAKIAYYGASFSGNLLARAGLSLDDFRPIQAAMSAGEVERATAMVTPAMLRLGIAGDVDELVTRCQGLLAAGATHLSFGPPLGPDVVVSVRLIGTQAMPRLRTGRREVT
jgi:5,10-methylenetetrahydromethanopterin reductase